MLENHSFDEMLGCYKSIYPHLEGIDKKNPKSNVDAAGLVYTQKPKTSLFMRYDPKHEHVDVMSQIADENSGFIKDFIKAYPKSEKQDRDNIMGYYTRGSLPTLHALADDFTICDHWFSSLPGPTWPNRFFALSGTSSGKVMMPEGFEHPHLGTVIAQTQPTIFDHLNAGRRSWKIYYHDFPSSLIFKNLRAPHNLANYAHIDEFFNKTDALLSDEDIPEFAFIEPKYLGIDQNDDHPPHNIMKAEKLIADVYNAIRSNKDLWESTLLVVVFDEHGGFYDHVSPPDTTPPDDKTDEYDFKKLGVRVPAILVSPWVGRTVLQTQFDHTSLLKYLLEKWTLPPLTARVAAANSISKAINQTQARQDTVSFIRIPSEELMKTDSKANEYAMTSHQEAIHAFVDYLKTESAITKDFIAEEAVDISSRFSRWWIKTSAIWAKRLHNWGDMLVSRSNQLENSAISVVKSLLEKE